MAVEVLYSEKGAVLFDNTTDWAFGPKFDDYECAEDFLIWLREDGGLQPEACAINEPRKCRDPRAYSQAQLERLYARWQKERLDENGYLTGETAYAT